MPRSMSVEPFEALLEHALARPGTGRAIADDRRATRVAGIERRVGPALLRSAQTAGAAAAQDLRRPAHRRGALRLFCFPHAGGGAAAFKDWAERLPPSVVVVPMRPPRRRSRLNMADLVAALGDAIEPYLDEPFAFFGHSMGAIVAFELARLLRRRNRPLPRMLVASGARAPQFRRGHVPPPEPARSANSWKRCGVLKEPHPKCSTIPSSCN